LTDRRHRRSAVVDAARHATVETIATERHGGPTSASTPRASNRGRIESLLDWTIDARRPATVILGIVVASALVRTVIGLRVPSVWILPDEIVYSELAKSIAAGERPSIRGVPSFGWGELYPTLIAPAWIVFDDPVRAYHAALAINAVVMSLAAVPAYLLARVFVSRGLSLLVALMTIIVPSMTYTGVVMTENAFYPVFLLALYLVARAVREPSISNQAIALTGLLVVAVTRVQGVALFAAYAGALLIFAWTGPASGRRTYLRRLVPTMFALTTVSVAPFVVSLVRGDGVFGWLGVRSGTFSELRVREVPEWFAYLIADIALYVAVVPLAASVVVITLGLLRRSAERGRLFAAIALPTIVAMLVTVSFVSAGLDPDGFENVNERYLFYLAPVTFVGLAVWASEGFPRPRRLAWTLVALFTVLPALLPFERFAYNARFQSLALLPWLELPTSGMALAILVGASSFVLGAFWLTLHPHQTVRPWLLPAVCLVAIGVLATHKAVAPASDFAGSFEGRPATWVDRSVPDGTSVDVVWNEGADDRKTTDLLEYWLFVTEFFNTRVDDVYRIGQRTYYETFLPTIPARMRSDGVVVTGDGTPVSSAYVLVTCRAPVDGDVIATGPHGWLRLVAPRGPLRISKGRCVPKVP
jgi:hypothetical protein